MEAGTPLAVAEDKVVLVVDVGDDDVLDVGAAVMVASAGAGSSRGAEERKAQIVFHSLKTCLHV